MTDQQKTVIARASMAANGVDVNKALNYCWHEGELFCFSTRTANTTQLPYERHAIDAVLLAIRKEGE